MDEISRILAQLKTVLHYYATGEGYHISAGMGKFTDEEAQRILSKNFMCRQTRCCRWFIFLILDNYVYKVSSEELKESLIKTYPNSSHNVFSTGIYVI